jgi:hypothetical protein
MVDTSMLRKFHEYLSSICIPFIHAIEEPNLSSQQLGVFKALWKADLVILIISPASNNSKWVLLELLVARLIFRPVIRIDAKELVPWKTREQMI